MAEGNDRPIPGNGMRVPFRRSDGDGHGNDRHSGHHSERDRDRGRNRSADRSGNRGYRTDRPPQPRPSRWDNANANGNTTGRRDSYDERENAQGRRRGGTAADTGIDSDRNFAGNGCRERNDRGRFDRDNDGRYGPSSTRGNEYRGSRNKEHDDRFRRDGNRDDRYNESRRRGESRYRDGGGEDGGRYRNRRERSDSGYYSDEYGDSRRDSRRYEHERSRRGGGSRDSFDRTRRHSTDFTSDDDEGKGHEESKEWPPCFQKDGSAFTFDVRSAMFYEPLSDFFYDPKSKLYYGNKKCAYFRYDEKKDPPFVQVQKMTEEQVEEQKRGDTGGIAQEKVGLHTPAPAAPSKPKIAIKFKTKKVKSSASTLAAQKCDSLQQPVTNTVSKAKQQQIANIGKWHEKQAELKDSLPKAAGAESSQEPPSQMQSQPQKVRTTAKGEPICMICRKKFPTLAKLRLHEKASELHKKNMIALQEKRKKKLVAAVAAGGTKRKLDDATTGATPDPSANAAPVYTDRAEKRRQLHGTDVCAPAQGSLLQLQSQIEAPRPEPLILTDPGTDLLDENNVGHKMLQKMGYKADPHQQTQQQQDSTGGRSGDGNSENKPKTVNDHLRKEWDRIEAMAQKSAPRSRY